ncbi:MAG: dihydrolipoyl dehydrogenase [Thermoplasmata archaeon]
MKDAVIIGSGPGGYYCALRLAKLGKNVAIVEEENMGGVCTNAGCIPTKALLESARILHEARSSERMGVECSPKLDFEKAKKNAEISVMRSRKGIEHLLHQANVSILRGRGRLAEENVVKISGENEGTIEANHIVVATGSHTRNLPSVAYDGRTILSSKELLDIGHVPESLLIIGGGSIGVEFATIFGTFGSRVTVVELLPSLLPMESHIVGETMEKILKRRGVRVLTNVAVKEVNLSGGEALATLNDEDGTEIRAEKVLLSVGRAPNVDEGLIRLGIKLDKEGIVVNERMQTTIPSVYAIGDVVGEPMLAHSAWAEAEVAALNIAGIPAKMEYDYIPRCIYTFPEVASFGLTEERAKERGFDVRLGEFPLAANARARISGKKDGFARITVDAKTKHILGACAIAPHAAEMIQELVLAARLGVSYEEIGRTIHPHPTVSEVLFEAARDIEDESLHK